MIVEITLKDDDGKILASHSDSALRPSQWRCPPDKPLSEGKLQFFGFAFQPLVRLLTKEGGY